LAGKSIIIIGAGLAGLSTGCYARMNGYSTRIFESHTLPGGALHRLAAQGVYHRRLHPLVDGL